MTFSSLKSALTIVLVILSLVSCKKEKAADTPPNIIPQNRSSDFISPERSVGVVFFEFKDQSENPENKVHLEKVEAILHNKNAWMEKGQHIELLAVDSGMKKIPAKNKVHRFFSKRKVTELRMHDAMKVKMKWEQANENGQPVISFLLYRNEANHWRKYANPGQFTYPRQENLPEMEVPDIVDWIIEKIVLLSFK